MRQVLRTALIAAMAALVVGPAPAAPTDARRTVICNARSASITFEAGAAVVRSGDDRTLARVTQKARSVSGSCTRYQRLGISRGLLDHSLKRGKATCSGGARLIVETEPVRNANGRVIGNRLALWMTGLGRELAEVFVAGKRSWFSYASSFCHAG
jgi:hypothetical protein